MTNVVHFLEQDLVFKEKPINKRFQDLTALEFSKLTVLGFAGKRHWFCKCHCDKITKVYAGDLKSGHTNSCGCSQIEDVRRRSTIHGHAERNNESSTYCSWQSMLKRCLNPKHHQFQDYGGRGIKVCDRWLKFENFLADMGERPTGLTLERKENDKGYYQANCRWASPKEQANNRRSNRLITYNGKTQTMTQWAEEISVQVATLWKRLKLGWSIERALTKNNLKINRT